MKAVGEPADDPAPRAAGSAARAAAESAARAAYGRLVAWLAWQWRDLAAAEDAMSEAFAVALERWPRDGVPSSPEAWLLTTAKRELLMRHRRSKLEQSPEVTALLEAEPLADAPETLLAALPDRRLQLMCVCAHPTIDAALHAPLMLQAVLGLDAKTIARAFLVAPSAMAQRLVRAKAKIRDAGLRFEEPGADELPARISAVLEGIYGAYTIASDLASPAPEAEPMLREEAVFLARLVVQLKADDAEALGLLALLLHNEARRPAQFRDDAFVPLTRQDTGLWRRDSMQEAEAALWRAAALRSPGPLQLEAAIQSAHHQRAFSGHTPWAQIAELYGLLVEHHGGSIGARIGQAVALAEAGSLDRALVVIEALPAASVATHQPWWAARAHLLERAGRDAEARAARERAAGLTADPRVRRFLLRHDSGAADSAIPPPNS